MSESYSATNLIINNIPASASDEQLTKLFKKYGSIKSCKIIRSNEKEGKIFGFCEYNDSNSAKTAVSNLDKVLVIDRTLRVSYAKLFPKPKGKTIEVTNIPKSITEENIKRFFIQYGKILRMRCNMNKSPYQTAEIIYESKSEAEKASLNSQVMFPTDSGKLISLNVNLVNQDRDIYDDNKSFSYRNIYNNSQKQMMYQLGDENINPNYFYYNQTSYSQPVLATPHQMATSNRVQQVTQAHPSNLYNATNQTSPYDFTLLSSSLTQHPQNINALYPTSLGPNIAISGLHPNAFYPSVGPTSYYFSIPSNNTPLPSYHQQTNNNHHSGSSAPNSSSSNSNNNNTTPPVTLTSPYPSNVAQVSDFNAVATAAVLASGYYPTNPHNPYTANPLAAAAVGHPHNSPPSIYPTNHMTPTQASTHHPIIYGPPAPPILQQAPYSTNIHNTANNNNPNSTIQNNGTISSIIPAQQQQQYEKNYQHHHHNPNHNNNSNNYNRSQHNHSIQTSSYYNNSNYKASGLTGYPSAASSSSNTIQSSATNIAAHVVYVYNIGNSTNREQLRDLFSTPNSNGSPNKFARDIIKIDIPKENSSLAINNNNNTANNNINNMSCATTNKNFGFITFSSAKSAKMAIDEMNGKDYQGKALQVSFKK